MLNGLSPQAGKIWKKANLTFSLDGKHMTKTFLICNTGSHAAILGLKWLDAHNPEIDWNYKNPLEGVPPEYHQCAKVFGEEEFYKLPPHQHYDIGIELTKEGPLNSPLYSMTDTKSTTLKDWLRDKLKASKVCPSKLSISSLVIPKRMCTLPSPDDLMAQLCSAKIFTKLDLRWGYNNVCVKEGDKWKTAFQTKYSLYKSLVMTFGLTKAPAAFQHFMNKLFKDLLDVCVIIYLDNILIYSKDNTSHMQHIHEVLQCLMDNQLFCKALKCTFHISLVKYLGIIVSDKGFSLDKLKIQAVQEWPTPTKVKEVQSFLGFANSLCCFVANFSHMAWLLHNLVKKDTPWKWLEKEQGAFESIKEAITNAPVLAHADPSKPYFLETNALGVALGSILSQCQEDSRLHPLGFLSELLKGAKQNYNAHNKELLAIIRSFKYWCIFLEGTLHPVTVFTNHQNLEYWKESWTFNCCHARWPLLLAGYHFQVVYWPSKQSGKPNALSCRSDHADVPPGNQTMLPEPVFANITLVTPKKELQHQIKAALDQDKSLEEILQFLQNESKAPPSIKQAFKDYKMEAGLLFYQGRISPGRPPRQATDTGTTIRKPKYASIPPQLLDLPTRPWQHILYNMIVDLPRDGNHDSILVIVDSFTKYVTLVECSKKLKAPELALYQCLGIDPHYLSAYHPQSNGQTEHVNPSVEHFLRAYSGVNWKDWFKWLPMVEFAYNNAVHSMTSMTPFKALHR
ncbi:Retrotransposable element Tf2 protein [Rhizoctonia solani]|uniref:Retrotransposable element Tf2 protein n=1 Tax=Rhizoctonia solani TaxID=456999 RepID=A0A8H8NQU6_9AGAM|nr:Retrotransposable element Tf2 protein [Rhizoctonia solani]QRW16920.1 Retrotransposable element Tf2 protein [Rhizoctonia solani]